MNNYIPPFTITNIMLDRISSIMKKIGKLENYKDLNNDMSIATLFLSAFIALPLSIIGLIKNNNNVLPFGPYLSIAALKILLMVK